MNDIERYKIHQEEIEIRYDSICKRCGRCCGAEGSDPCKNLIKLKDGAYYCRVYPDRLGEQETVSGRKFNCVSIREVLKYKDTLLDCVYRKVRL